MANICVIALIGLPGAGKTTFCKNILKCSLEYNCIHICYDEMFKFHPESNEETFKNERKKVIKQIEQIIGELKPNCQDVQEDFCTNSTKLSIILVDDNNYYAGMRYDIYKVCKANHLSFGQVYLPIDLDCALARNASRSSNALPSSVIERMHARLEIPSQKNQWEKNTFIVNNSNGVKQLDVILKKWFLNPVKTVPNINNCPTKTSLVHEVDICLRKRIKEILQNSEENLTEKATILNNKRKYILLNLRKNNVSDETSNVQSICEGFTL